MERNVIIAILVLSIPVFVYLLVVGKLPSTRKRIRAMPDRKLVEHKVTMRKMQWLMVLVALVSPLMSWDVIRHLQQPEMRSILIVVFALPTIGAWPMFFMFWDMTKIAQSEIEFRKFQNEKGKSTEQTPGVRQ